MKICSLIVITLSLIASGSWATPERNGHVNIWLSHGTDNPEDLPSKNLGNEVYYQVFLDRFANGNTANDCLHDGKFCDTTRNKWFKYWGGDLRGLINRMDYLKDLGVSRLWLTPIFENQQVTVDRVKHGQEVQVTSYHGYWIRDWFRLNPYFTDNGTLDFAIVDELIESAGPEMKIILDTVANHTSPSDATEWSLNYLNEIEPLRSSQSHRGALFRDGSYVTSIEEDEDRANEPGYVRKFHRYGPIQNYNDEYQVENFQLDGLSDFDQNSALIRQYLLDAHLFWLRRFPGLGGYRMDTIKHVDQSYWDIFNRDFFSIYPEKEVVGEYFGAGTWARDSHPYYKTTNMSMFDFDFRQTLINVFQHGQSMWNFQRIWEKDGRLIDAKQLVTFLDNHDVSRVRGTGMSYQRMRQAVAMLMTSRGVPCIYYGMEQDLFYPGDPGDPYNRPMMTRFDTNHDMYRLIKGLIGLRKRNGALRYGDTHIVHLSDKIIAFERVLEGEKVFVMLSTNPRQGQDQFTVEGMTLRSGRYRDVLTGKRYEVNNGRLPIQIGNGDIIVLSQESTN